MHPDEPNDLRGGDLLHVEETAWVWARPTGMPTYDFAVDRHFACRRPWRVEGEVTAILRAGATGDYAGRFDTLLRRGVRAIHDPAEHARASLLPHWFPPLSDLTPRSEWHDDFPPAADVEDRLGWPVFLKGERQTSRHRAATSVVGSAEDYERARQLWADDPILRWQRVVVREFVSLRPADARAAPAGPGVIPASFEFRAFCWRGEVVGVGRYWTGAAYDAATADELRAVADLAREAAGRVGVAFLAVDVAQAADGRWIVVECNDGQDAGYAGVRPLPMWRRLLDAERARGP